MRIEELKAEIASGRLDEQLVGLYGAERLEEQKRRYICAADHFAEMYPSRTDISIFSAPGRTEVCGNHTDHQHGCVLAAAINLDTIALVAFHQDGVIRIYSEGYGADAVELEDLAIHAEEYGTTKALLRGMAAQFLERGAQIGGFDAYILSDVLGGSGLSSSAAFEVLIGTILDQQYYEGKAGAVEIAKMGQYAENRYFGKKSGLMDQMVSSVGGFVYIDFQDITAPEIEKYTCDFGAAGLQLCITDTKGSHADLTEDYVSVPEEMHQIAAWFGKQYLREVSEEQFFGAIGSLQGSISHRAILRAAHFYGENVRVRQEVEALTQQNIPEFLRLVKASGDSSAKWLQNLYSIRKYREQGIVLGLMQSERILNGAGACRVHGGGFAGTIQAFVPKDRVEAYRNAMEELFGQGSCYCLSIRSEGGVKII